MDQKPLAETNLAENAPVIDLSSGKITITTDVGTTDVGTTDVGKKTFNLVSFNNVAPLTSQIVHKQESPTWYATDSYYANRELLLPPSFDKSRYLKSVIGKYAVYLSKDLVIHSSPFDNSEVSGIRFKEDDLKELYNIVKVGDSITIK